MKNPNENNKRSIDNNSLHHRMKNAIDMKLKGSKQRIKATKLDKVLWEGTTLIPSKVLPYFAILLFICLCCSFKLQNAVSVERQSPIKKLRALEIEDRFYPKSSAPSNDENNNDVDKTNDKMAVSLVISALKDTANLSHLLRSIASQAQDFSEIIIVDIGCDPQTERTIHHVFPNTENDRMNVRYSRQCDPQVSAKMSDQAVKMVSKNSKWILFLNEGIILQGSTFINDLLKLGESQSNAGAVGCKLLSKHGDKVISAGNIIWRDGQTTEFGLDYENIDSSELSFPRIVDYISPPCIMVKKDVFLRYEGFHTKYFNDDYQVRDLQMFIQHNLGKDVWYQPQSVAYYDYKRSPVGTDRILQRESRNIFQAKWKHHLTKHPVAPIMLKELDRELAVLRASDLRFRDSSKANILYLNEQIPNNSLGSGLTRALSNLSMLSSLGHKITVLSSNSADDDDVCDDACIRKLEDFTIEVVTDSWQEFLDQRGSSFEVIIVASPTILKLNHELLRNLYKKNPFALIYDCDALEYRSDETMINQVANGIHFPSFTERKLDIETIKMVTERHKKTENILVSMADIVVSVSEDESDLISVLSPNLQIEIIGPLNVSKQPQTSFHKREGILYLASFQGSMYHNGDAIWYFLREIYPLVLKDASIPLTIAGRKIPDKLRSFTKTIGLDQYVEFVDSSEDVSTLYEKARIFIAPHLYGAGVQAKVSKSSI